MALKIEDIVNFHKSAAVSLNGEIVMSNTLLIHVDSVHASGGNIRAIPIVGCHGANGVLDPIGSTHNIPDAHGPINAKVTTISIESTN